MLYDLPVSRPTSLITLSNITAKDCHVSTIKYLAFSYSQVITVLYVIKSFVFGETKVSDEEPLA